MYLTLTLEQRLGTVESKMERLGDIIYQYGAEYFGVQEAKGAKEVSIPIVSWRQQEIKETAQETLSEVEKKGTNSAEQRTCENAGGRKNK